MPRLTHAPRRGACSARAIALCASRRAMGRVLERLRLDRRPAGAGGAASGRVRGRRRRDATPLRHAGLPRRAGAKPAHVRQPRTAPPARGQSRATTRRRPRSTTRRSGHSWASSPSCYRSSFNRAARGQSGSADAPPQGPGNEKHKGGTLMSAGDDLDACLLSWLTGAPVPEARCRVAAMFGPPAPRRAPDETTRRHRMTDRLRAAAGRGMGSALVFALTAGLMTALPPASIR